MITPHPVPDPLTPGEHFHASRFRARVREAAGGKLTRDELAAIYEAGAALIRQCARTPRSQQDPRRQNGGA